MRHKRGEQARRYFEEGEKHVTLMERNLPLLFFAIAWRGLGVKTCSESDDNHTWSMASINHQSMDGMTP